jgi:hypothetical protein
MAKTQVAVLQKELTQRESELLVHDVKQLHIVQHNWTQFSSHESSISGAG